MNMSPTEDQEKGPGLVDQSNDPSNTQCDFITDTKSAAGRVFPEVTFTVGKASDGTPQSKRFHLQDGEVIATPPVFASKGTAVAVRCTLDQIPECFEKPDSFMVLGVARGVEVGEVYTHKAEKVPGPGISRTKANYIWPTDTAALAVIDADLKAENVYPPMQSWFAMDQDFIAEGVLLLVDEALKSVGSTLRGVGLSARRSSSSNIRDEAGQIVKDSKGVHIFLALKGKTPGELLDFLHKQLVIAGHGHCYVESNGRLDVRTIIDRKVGDPNRVMFEAPPTLGPGLSREQGNSRSGRGGVLDLTEINLTVNDAEYKKVEAELKQQAEVRALVADRKKELTQRKVAEFEERGLAAQDARDFVERTFGDRERTDLYPRDGLIFRFDDGREVKIADIVAAPGDYHECSLMDPFDLKERPGKAKFYWNRKTDLSPEQFVINLIRNGQTVFLHGEDIEEREERVSGDSVLSEAVRVLAGLPQLDYERVRKDEAAKLGISRVQMLDDAVKKERSRLVADDTDDADGRRPATLGNVVKALKNPAVSGIEIAFDEFTATQVWTPAGETAWQEWTDSKSVELRMLLAATELKEVSKDIMRDALIQAADSNRIDTAQIWAKGLPEWDGIPRCESFFIDHFESANTPYTRAVGWYIWSALAGRVMDPGAKADMIPALIGEQGARKSSGVAAMAPTTEAFAEINLHDKEDDLKRKMIGTLIGEIGELAGHNKREVQWFKAFSVRRVEQWVPKWCERRVTYPRRLIFIATTNEERFLKDSTGERRWLPLKVGQVDVNGIIENRDQLWAEAFKLFREQGILFADAERLARKVVGHHKEECPDADLISEWLEKEDWQNKTKWKERPYIKTIEVADALRLDPKDVDRHKNRISNAMRLLGYKSNKRRFEVGSPPFHAWVKPE